MGLLTDCAERVANLVASRVPVIWVTTGDITSASAFIEASLKGRDIATKWWDPVQRISDNRIYTVETSSEKSAADRVNDILNDSAALNLASEILKWSKTTVRRGYDAGSVGGSGEVLVLQGPETEMKSDVVDALYTLEEFSRIASYGRDRRVRQTAYYSIVVITTRHEVPGKLHPVVQAVEFPPPDEEMITDIVNKVVEKAVSDSASIKKSYSISERAAIIDACKGMYKGELLSALMHSIIKDGFVNPASVIAFKRESIRRDDVLDIVEEELSEKDIGGLDVLKTWIMRQRATLTKAGKEFGTKLPTGLLIVGIPGTGKSLTAKAAGGILGLPVIRMDVGKLMSGLVGSSEERTRRALGLALSVSPCILWIDEVEKSLSGAGSSRNSDGGTTARVFGTILTWMQEKAPGKVLVIATANSIGGTNGELPVEFVRRFNEVFFVDFPNREERKEIFSIHLKKLNPPRNPKKFNLDALVSASENITGHEIERAIQQAVNKYASDMLSSKKKSVSGKIRGDIQTDHIIEILNSTISIIQTKRQEIEAIRRWALEEGRAILASKPDADGITADI